MAHDTDILICGGGLNGCTLALALAQAGFAVTLVDRLAAETRAEPGFDGRSYALAMASTRALAALGLWDQLMADAGPILQVKASDGRAGEGPSPWFLHFHQADLGEGPLGHMVEDRHLRPVLLKAVEAEAKITHLPEQEVAEQQRADHENHPGDHNGGSDVLASNFRPIVFSQDAWKQGKPLYADDHG